MKSQGNGAYLRQSAPGSAQASVAQGLQRELASGTYTVRSWVSDTLDGGPSATAPQVSTQVVHVG